MATKQRRQKGKRVAKRDYVRKRQTYSAYGRSQRADRAEQGEQQKSEKTGKKGGSSWRLVISAVILVSVIAVKLLLPQSLEQIRGPLLHLMGTDTDFAAVFSTVGEVIGTGDSWGEKLQEVYVSVFSPQNSGGTSDETGVITCYTPENTPDHVWLQQKLLGFSYQRPVEGTISDQFGYRTHPIDNNGQFHYGIDLQADEGTVIRSFADGEVTAVGESATLGKYVTVQHEGGYQTLYAHCSRVTASSGQLVQMGDPIAEVGQTGQATGPHLHFELLLDTLYLNPVYYVTE